jgi:hypothetical protein
VSCAPLYALSGHPPTPAQAKPGASVRSGAAAPRRCRAAAAPPAHRYCFSHAFHRCPNQPLWHGNAVWYEPPGIATCKSRDQVRAYLPCPFASVAGTNVKPGGSSTPASLQRCLCAMPRNRQETFRDTAHRPPMRWQPPSSTTLSPLQQVTAVAQSSRPVFFPLGPTWFPCRLGVCRASSMYSLAGPCCSCIRRLWRCHCIPSAMEHAASSQCRSRKMPMNSVSTPLWRTGHATFRQEFRQSCCWPTQPLSLPHWRLVSLLAPMPFKHSLQTLPLNTSMHPVGARVHASVATTRMSLQTEAAQIVVAGHVVLTHNGIFESVAHSSQEKLTPPLEAAYAVACPSSPATVLQRCWFARSPPTMFSVGLASLDLLLRMLM